MEDELIVATDGSARVNPGVGGWAFIIDHPEKRYQGWGREDFTTNNRMELTGAIEALKFVVERELLSTKEQPLKIISDSKYLVDGFNRWLPNWTQRNWRTFNKEPVKNSDLWKQLATFKELYNITLEWTKGHAGHELNELCDHLATQARDKKI